MAWIGSYLLILVGALEHGFYFSIELGMSSSQLTNSMIFQRGGEKPPTSYQWYEIPAPVDFYVFLFLPPQLEIVGFKKDPELPDAMSAQEEEQRQVGRNKGGCLPGFQGDFSNVFSLLHKKLQRIKMI